MQHKIFCVREFIKTESATAVQCAFHLRFNIQPPTRNSICRWNVIYITFVTSSNFEIQTYEIESIFLNHAVLWVRSVGRSVFVAGWVMRNCGPIPDGATDFSSSPKHQDQLCSPHILPHNRYCGILFQEGPVQKLTGAKHKNGCSCISSPPYAFMACTLTPVPYLQ